MTTMSPLADDSIVFTTPRVIARTEPDGVLLFHVISDELYFLSHAGYQLYQRCRGGPRVGELRQLAGGRDVRPYPQQLLERGLIETWDGEQA